MSRAKFIAAVTLAGALAAGPAMADPVLMLGGTFAFGGGSSNFGLSANVLSNDTNEKAAGGVGVTYYLGTGQVGFDVIAAWKKDDAAIGVGYDFGIRKPVVTFGYSKTRKDSAPPPPPPPA